MVDIFGKVVKEQKETVNKNGDISAIINATNLIAGIYEVRYYNGNITRSKKLVIVK